MSRAWIAFYMGDYLKKTQRLTTEQHGAYILLLVECWQMGRIPLDDESRAAIARMPIARWKKVGSGVAAFFDAEGKNKRATEEIEKAERVSMKRSLAGQVGGKRSGIAKAIARGQAIKHEANAKQMVKQIPKQIGEQPLSNCEANHNRKITNTTFLAEEPKQSAHSLASALPSGALTREPQTEQVAKRPADVTRTELEATFAARRAQPDGLEIPSYLRRSI